MDDLDDGRAAVPIRSVARQGMLDMAARHDAKGRELADQGRWADARERATASERLRAFAAGLSATT